jgi:hypothetical protein
MKSSLFISAFTLVLVLHGVAWADTSEDACVILAKNLKPDVLEQGTESQKFSQLQQLVSDNRYADWSNASSSSSSFSGSFSIPGEVDAAIGDGQSSNSTNWGTRRSQFLSMNFQQTSSNYKVTNRVSATSAAAVHEIVQCQIHLANRNGISAILEHISDDRKSFAVRLALRTDGDAANWSLKQFSVQPDDSEFKCNGAYEKASPEHPIKLHELTKEIVCSKSAGKSLTLGVSTTAGDPPAIVLTSIQEEMQQLRDQMTTQFTAQINALGAATNEQIKALNNTVGDLPSNFFKSLNFVTHFSNGPPQNDAVANCSGIGTLVGGACFGKWGGDQAAIGPLFRNATADRPLDEIRCVARGDLGGFVATAVAICMVRK